MFEFLMSILTYIINFFMKLCGFSSNIQQQEGQEQGGQEQQEKQVTFNEVAETSSGEVLPTQQPDLSA
jgi:hypothetical protein